MSTNITTAADVIDALGGSVSVAKLLGTRSNVVGNWRLRKLPAKSFHAMQTALAVRGLSAPVSLWDQYEIPKSGQKILKAWVVLRDASGEA